MKIIVSNQNLRMDSGVTAEYASTTVFLNEESFVERDR